MNKKRLEDIAHSLIDDSSKIRCRHFSFIVYKNRIIAIGQNNQKTHPVNLINKKTSADTGLDVSSEKYTCSEFNAVLKLKRLTNINSKKCELINIRIDKNKKIANSKPCMSCDNLLNFFEFKNVEWSNSHGEYESSKLHGK